MKLKRNSLKLFRFSFTSLCGQFKILDETDLWLTGNLTEASSNCLYIVTVSELQSVMSFVAAEVLKLPKSRVRRGSIGGCRQCFDSSEVSVMDESEQMVEDSYNDTVWPRHSPESCVTQQLPLLCC